MTGSPYKYTFDPAGDTTAARVLRNVGQGKYILELGCAYGVMTKAFVEHGHNRVFGIEYDAASAESAKPYCEELVVGDLEKMDLANVLGDRRFDVIVAADVLEHLRNPEAQLLELKKFLKPEGYIVLSIPNVAHNGVIAELLNEDFRYRETGLLDSSHLRFWGAQGMKRLLKKTGFAVMSAEASRLDADLSEFADSWNKLPDWIQEVLRDRQNGNAYQFVVTAKTSENSEDVGDDVWPVKVELTTHDSYRQRIEAAEQARVDITHELTTANAILEEMRATKSWRWTRPFRFMARLITHGFSAADREEIRRAYHQIAFPPWFKRLITFVVRTVVLKNFKRLKRLFFSFRKFRPPESPAVPQQANQPDYYFWGVIDWHFRHQRPQQLALALAETGRRVFYVAPAFRPDSRAGFEIEKIGDSGRVFQVTLFAPRETDIYSSAPSSDVVRFLRSSVGELLLWANSSQVVSVVQHSFWADVASVIPNNRLVYDCMDHHEGFKNTGTSLVSLEKRLLAFADLTITTSEWLDKKVAELTTHHAIIRNAGDFQYFTSRPTKIFRDEHGRRIIGYYGAIAEWFDLELVEQIARKFSECCILLIGADTINARTRLSRFKNVRFEGEVSYSSLPYYLHAFDICLLPFRVMPLTLATNPVKVYEYLSAGKPVISPELPEMKQFGDLVLTASNHGQFVEHLKQTLSKPETHDVIEKRKAFARGETWRQRATSLIENIETSSNDPQVSVVVVTYNNLDLTRACLRSLDENSLYEKLEIIVVDNASADGSPDFLKTWVAEKANRKLILNSDNKGFAAANNQGLDIAGGEFLVMLNNDTVVTPGWIRTMVGHLRRNPEIGILGPVTNNIGNEAKIEIDYANINEMPAAAARYTNRRIGQVFALRTVAFFCVMLRKSIYKEIGHLDEAFGRGFFEDDDYCRRIEKAGFKIACADDVFIHHQLSASFNKLKQQDRQKLFEENKITYEAKWGPWIPHSYRKPKLDLIGTAGIEPEQKSSLDGVCNVCGKSTRFEYEQPALWRESLFCQNCRTTSRYRSITRGILKALKEVSGASANSLATLPRKSQRGVRVYDTQPPFYYNECAYPLPDLLKAAGISVELSQYKPDLPAGAKIAAGVSNQNLEHLTFEDECFDLVVTSDVMEHVRRDSLAHKEIFRVLKPGGVYVFTVPNVPEWPETQVRVQVVEELDPTKDEHLMEPEYHGDTNGDSELGVLSYRTYGRDLLTYLQSIGFQVQYSRENIEQNGIMNTELYYCKKTPSPGPDS